MLYGLLSRCMERSVCTYHYDWYPDCTTVVHLRFCQGLFQTSSPTSTWNARISEEEAWSNWIDNSWTDCWLTQWWVSWNFYIFDYVENKLYNVIIGCALISCEGLNSTTVIAWNKWETECLVSVYYRICKLHFIVANTSNTLLASPSPTRNFFLKNTLFHTLETREMLLFHLKLGFHYFQRSAKNLSLHLEPTDHLPVKCCYCGTAELLNGRDETGVWSGDLVMISVFLTEIKGTLCILELFLPWDGHPNLTYTYLTNFCFCWLWNTPKNLAIRIVLWN